MDEISQKVKLFLSKYFLLFILLLIFFGLSFFSSLKESPSGDEMAHIFSGYSYVKTGEWRYNIEHPPFVKDLSGLSLRIINPIFPYDLFEKINIDYWGWQWELGGRMFYEYNKNPDLMLALARLPVILLSMVLAVVLFLFSKKYYGDKAAFFAASLYIFAPNIIAHSRYVTTDLGIALFYFATILTLVNYLENPEKKNLIYFSLAFFGALITKFSFVTLIPVIGLVYLSAPFFKKVRKEKLFGEYLTTAKSLSGAIIISILLTIFYTEIHTLKMSQEEVRSVITSTIPSNIYGIQDILYKMAKIVKGLPLYITGFAYVTKHSVDGHTAFLMGQLYQKGLWYYFPVVFFLKTQLTFFLLSILSLPVFLKSKKLTFVELSAVYGIIIYFAFSMTSSMNIGVRHLLPVYPLFFFLGAAAFNKIAVFKTRKRVWEAVFWGLLAIYAVEGIFSYPYYIQYSNQIIKDKKKSHEYFVDSNLDWGQSLKELGAVVKEKQIKEITIDYFANGASVEYYVPGAIKWDGKEPPKTDYFAVSATSYRFYNDRYKFLNGKEPEDVVGRAILLFKN